MEEWVSFPKLVTYCEKRLFKLLLTKLCEPIWLHGAPAHWTNNNTESGNHVLKKAANWQPQQLPELIAMLHDLINLQLMELERAMVGLGNFVLAKDYSHYYFFSRLGKTGPKAVRAKTKAFFFQQVAGRA